MVDRIMIFMFIVLLLIFACVIYLYSLPGALEPTANVHPEIASMLESNLDGRQPQYLLAGYGLGLCFLLVMTACVLLGMQKQGQLGWIGHSLLVGFALYLLIYSRLVWSYAHYQAAPDAFFSMGFPQPTSWMIYGIWLFPYLFILLYSLTFNRWFVTAQDLARFKELLERSSKTQRAT